MTAVTDARSLSRREKNSVLNNVWTRVLFWVAVLIGSQTHLFKNRLRQLLPVDDLNGYFFTRKAMDSQFDKACRDKCLRRQEGEAVMRLLTCLALAQRLLQTIGTNNLAVVHVLHVSWKTVVVCVPCRCCRSIAGLIGHDA